MIRDGDVGPPGEEQPIQFLLRVGDRRHGARNRGRCLRHQLAAPARGAQQVLQRQRLRRVQGGELAEAVTGYEVGLHTQLAQDREVRRTADPQCGLRPLRGRESLRLLLPRGVREGRLREDDVVER